MPFEHYKTKTDGWRARAVYYHDGTRETTKWIKCDAKGDEPDALKRWLNSKESMHLHGKLGQVDHEITVGALIDDWETAGQFKHVADTNKSNVRAHLRWWREEFGTAKYHGLHRPLIQARLRSKWDNPATRNRVRAALGSIITWHMKQGTLSEHMLKGLSEKETPVTDDAYSDAELRALFDALEQEQGEPRLLVACAIALSTGARQGAIWGLQKQDIDFASKLIRFQRKVKRNKHRAIPLQPWVEKLILDKVWPSWEDASPYTPLFQGERWRGSSWPSTVWTKVIDRAGIKRRKPFHTLRHTFVTRVLGEGVPVQWVARFTGHSMTTILSRYEHLTDQAMERVFSRTEDSRSEGQRLEDATRLP